MSTTARDVVNELVTRGYVRVPFEVHRIPEELIRTVSDTMASVIKQSRQFDERFTLTRRGESEPDMLLVHRGVAEGKDHKSFVHYSHDIPISLQKEIIERIPTWVSLSRLQLELNRFVERICAVLETEHSSLFGAQLSPLFRRSVTRSIPYSTTTLRGVFYPPSLEQKGAKAHFDRSFLTAHLGDQGGNLYAHHALQRGSSVSVSPRTGEILLFWGVKAFMLSQGRVVPLYHSASTLQYRERRALVRFNHLTVGKKVIDARTHYDETCRRLRLDPLDVYASAYDV